MVPAVGHAQHLAGVAAEAHRAEHRLEPAAVRRGDVLGARAGHEVALLVSGPRRSPPGRCGSWPGCPCAACTSSRRAMLGASPAGQRAACRCGNLPRMSLKQSPLHDRHVALGAKFAEFGGWEMPLEYPTGVLKEHAAVRGAVGIFDVSHLGKLVVRGAGAAEYLNRCLSNDLGRIGPGPGAVHAGLRRGDRRRRRRPDRLLPRRRPRAARPQRRQHAPRCERRLEDGRRRRASPITDHHETHAVLAVQGPKSDEVLSARRPADRARLHVLRGGSVRGPRRHRLPHRLHRASAATS